MHINEVLSRSISVGAPPSAVLSVIGDPERIPQWAPRFAARVRPAARGRWTIGSGQEEFEIRVLASREAGTVDFLAPDEDRGLFARVVPSGEGSALVLTLVLAAGTPGELIERQRAVLQEELEGVRELLKETSS